MPFVRSLLMSHLAELQQQRDELDRKAQQLRRQIDTKEFVMSTDVIVKTHPAITAIGFRTRTTHEAVFTDLPAGLTKVIGSLIEANVTPVGAPFTLFHQAPDGDTEGDIEMCVPVSEGVQLDEGLDPSGELTAVAVSAGPVASIVHRGSYEDMGKSYATVAMWVQEHGHVVTGSTREIYLNSPAEVAEEDLLTELLFPIDGEGEV